MSTLEEAMEAVFAHDRATNHEEIVGRWIDRIESARANTRLMLESTPSKLDFFIDNRILAGRGFLITGLGGSSKSRLLYHLAIGAAVGHLPWGWEIKQEGKAVLFLTEDTLEDVHRTLHAIAREIKLTDEEMDRVADRVICIPLAGELFQMLEIRGHELRRNALFEAVRKYVEDIGDVRFIGLDPALSLTQGDEMQQAHQRALGQLADHLAVQTGAACALVSHAAKGITAKETLDSHNSRGGGAITDAVRAEITMRNMTPDEARKARVLDADERHYFVQMAVTKANHLPPSAKAPIWLKRGAGGALLPADLGVNAIVAQSPAEDRQMMDCLMVLVALCKSGHPTLKEWRDECVYLGIVKVSSGSANPDEAVKKAFQRIVTGLRDTGRIESAARGHWSPVADLLNNEGTND